MSGIDTITNDDLQQLLSELTKPELAGNLLAIHLNDHGINEDHIQKEDIMDLFQIQPEMVNKEHKQGFYEAFIFALSKARGSKHVIDKANQFKYVNVINKALNKDGSNVRNKQAGPNLLQGIHMQMVFERKLLQKVGSLSPNIGLGKSPNKCSVDHFVLNRKWNIPEIVFNQNPAQDENMKKRFFELDHELKWRHIDNHNSQK